MWKPIRKFLNDIHLYAGLISGLIVIAVCLSGTIYVYNTEIREIFDSERYFVDNQGAPQSLDALKSNLETQVEGQIVGVNVFNEEGRTVQFSVRSTAAAPATPHPPSQTSDPPPATPAASTPTPAPHVRAPLPASVRWRCCRCSC